MSPYLRPKAKKMTPYWRENQKLRIACTGQLYFVSGTLEVNQRFSSNRSFVFRLAGHLCTAILADTTLVPYLRITSGTQYAKRDKNDTLFKDQEPQKPYPIPWHIAHLWEYPPFQLLSFQSSVNLAQLCSKQMFQVWLAEFKISPCSQGEMRRSLAYCKICK